jgi:hypothetical protein
LEIKKSRGIVSTPCHADVVDGEFPSALYQRLVKSTVVSSEHNIGNRKQIKITVKPCWHQPNVNAKKGKRKRNPNCDTPVIWRRYQK